MGESVYRPSTLPPSPYHERTTCRLCGRAKLTQVFKLPATPLANDFVQAPIDQPPIPLIVMQCGACGHAQLKHVVDPRRLFHNYKYASGTSAVFRAHFAEYAETVIKQQNLQPGDFVLEIGSNDGTLLKEFQNRGMRVLGVEPAQNLADLAMDEKIPTINAFFEQSIVDRIESGNGRAKVIVANNVFAHIDELVSTFRACREMLSPEGALIFEVQYVGALLEKGLFDMVYHEHLDYHALAPLVAYFKSTRLGITHVEKVNTHGGSLRVTASKTMPTEHESVRDLLREEQVLRINEPHGWEALTRDVSIATSRLTSTLSDAFTADPDATVVGFGAPAKATTLLYALGLKRTDIDYIVDDSPLKQGLFTPGMHIPVYAPDRLLAEPPSHIIVLAWNFAESIIEKWQPILPKTKFIVPFTR